MNTIPIIILILFGSFCFIAWIIGCHVSHKSIGRIEPFILSTTTTHTKRHQRGAMAIAAREVFANTTEHLTYAQVIERVQEIRRLSNARTRERVDGMITTGMIIEHIDGTFTRSVDA